MTPPLPTPAGVIVQIDASDSSTTTLVSAPPVSARTGRSWSGIARATGTTRQAVWMCYGRKE